MSLKGPILAVLSIGIIMHFASFTYTGPASSDEIESTNQDVELSAKQLVVMIDGRFPTSGALTSGAGIVVGRKGGLLYIATARHVIEEIAETAVDLKVQFADRPGVEVDAFILQNELDSGLDLSLIGVPEALAPDSIKGQVSLNVARLQPKVEKGEGIAFLGQPSGEPWKLSPIGQQVLQSGITKLEIASTDAQPGYSGGAAVDENFRIVGIIVSTDGSRVSIIPLPLIKEKIEERSFPFDLENTDRVLVIIDEKSVAKNRIIDAGYSVDASGYLSVLDDEAISIFGPFEELNPQIDLSSFVDGIASLPESRLENVSRRIADSGLDAIVELRVELKAWMEGDLSAFKFWSLDYPTECNRAKSHKYGILFSGISCDDDYGSISAFLSQLTHVARMSRYNKYVDKEVSSYVPKWFTENISPESVPLITYTDRINLTSIPQCTYAIVNAMVSVSPSDKISFIPMQGNSGKYFTNGNLVADQRVARRLSRYCPKLVSGDQELINPCITEALLARECDGSITFVSLRNTLLSDAEESSRLYKMGKLGRRLNESWSTSLDRRGNVFATMVAGKGRFDPSFLSIRCFEDRVIINSDLKNFYTDIPNKVPLVLHFKSGDEEITLHGQEKNPISPYIATAQMLSPLLDKLVKEAGPVRMSIAENTIGYLPLRGSAAAFRKALTGKGCFLG